MSATEILQQLEAAGEGSRELDVAIWACLQSDRIKIVKFWPAYSNPKLTAVSFTLPPKRTEICTRDKGDYTHADPVTTSLDAALALAERVLPGCEPGVMVEQRFSDGRVQWGAWTSTKEHTDIYGWSPALALCAAILRAKQ